MKKNKLFNLIIIIISILLTSLYVKFEKNINTLIIASSFLELYIITKIILNIKDVIKNKNFAIIINGFIPICLLVIQHIWPNNAVYFFNIIYIYLVLFAKNLGNFIKKEFPFLLVISTYINMLLVFVMGLLDKLILYKYTFIGLIIITFIIYLITCLKNKEDSFVLLNNKYVSIMSILFLFSIVGSYGRFVHIYDEYSLWAYDVKYSLYYNHIGYSSYAPILTMWQYMNSMYTGFHDFSCYFALNFLVYINLLPITSYIKNKKIFLISSFILLNSFYLLGDGTFGFNSLYADLIFSCIFINCFLQYKNYDYDKKPEKLLFLLNFFVLTLTKPQGIIMSFIILFYSYVNKLINDIKYEKTFKDNFILIWNLTKKYIIPGIYILLVFFGWNFYYNHFFVPASDRYQFVLISDSLKSDLYLKMNKSFIMKFILQVCESMDSYIIYGKMRLTLLQFIVGYFSLLTYIIYLKTNDIKKSIKKALPYLLTYIMFFGLTLLSLFVQFSVYEASVLASFGRYLNSFTYLLFVIFLLIILSDKFRIKNLKFSNLMIILFILIVPFKNYTYFISDYKSRVETKQIKLNNEDDFKYVNQKTDKNSRIFILDQKEKNGIMAEWYARYYLFPRYTNASAVAITWKVITESNKDDLGGWGLTYKKFKNHLKEYKFDYIYLYTTDKYLNEYLENDINTDSKIKDHMLFKIEYDKNNNVKFKLVK